MSLWQLRHDDVVLVEAFNLRLHTTVTNPTLITIYSGMYRVWHL